MRDKPKDWIDPETGYPTREAMEWKHEEALELLKNFMSKMGEDAFIQHGIKICNKMGRKHFKTREDLLTFMEKVPKLMACYFTMHGKEAENEKNNRPWAPITIDD